MVEALVADTARSVGLEGDAELLVTGFNAFLNSQDNRDQHEIYALCQAMFAARLVAADVGADPIVTADMRNSLILVDTNILFAGALEKHRLAQALLAVGRALRLIGCRVAFLHLTKLEYQASIDRHREAVLRALEKFTLNVVSGASDAIITTAVARGCRTHDDYQVFFEQVADPIAALQDSFPVEELDDAEIDRIAEEGAQDNNLKAEIKRVWQAAGRRRTKGESLLQHDAAVMTVAERLNREGQKTWVLTLDRTMQDLSLHRAGPYRSPSCLALDTLVEVLALDEAGPEIQAEEFVPILISMLDFEVGPHPNTYMVHDLMWLLDIEERSVALRDDRVKTVAATVARERLAGRPRNDPELHLIVQRAFQEEKMAETEAATEENRREVRELKEALATERDATQRLRGAYLRERVSQLRRDALLRLIATVASYTTLSAVVILLMYRVTLWASKFGEYASLAVALFGLAMPATGLIWQIGEAFPRYRSRIQSAEERARQEIMP